MGYGEIKEAGDVKKIAEAEFGIGKSLKTTRLDSCVCVVGRVKDKDEVLVMHLVAVKDDVFDDDAAEEVGEILEDKSVSPEEACLVGIASIWVDDDQIKGAKKLREEILKGIKKGDERAKETGRKLIEVEFNADEKYGFTYKEVDE